MRRQLWLLLALALLPGGHASAQSVKDVIEGFGLVGDWKSDCSDPQSRFERWSVSPAGAVELRSGIGNNFVTYTVATAQRSGSDEMRVRARIFIHGNETTRDIVLVRKDGKLRNWSVVRPDGEFVVKDGISVSTEQQTPWLARCP
jgi:hypothetical protein